MGLIIGSYYDNITCELFKDPEAGRMRVRPLPGQCLPTKILIECSKKEREAHPVGTKFKTENIKVCKKPTGRMYLYAKDKMIYKLQ